MDKYWHNYWQAQIMTCPIRFPPPFHVRSLNYMRPLVHIPCYFILHLFCIRLNSSRLLAKLDWELCSAFFEKYNQFGMDKYWHNYWQAQIMTCPIRFPPPFMSVP